MTQNDQILPAYYGYIGSKAGFGSKLGSLLPIEAFVARLELFFGGGGFFYSLPKAKVNILNDIDANVMDTHEAVAAMPEVVMTELELLRPSRRTFEQLRDLRLTATWNELAPAKRAAAFIYLAKNSINGVMRYFSNSTKTRSAFNPHFDLMPYAAKFEGVTFENLHWKEALDRFVFKPKEVTLFVYADPPYVVADTKKHYRFNFDPVEHIMLARTLSHINELNNGASRNIKVMLSYDDDPDGFIRSLYREEFGWRIATIDVQYEADHRANMCRKELVIMNYDPPTGDCEGAAATGGGPAQATALQPSAA